MRLAKRRRGEKVRKPYAWIDAGIHGREWISPASILCFVNLLLSNSSSEILNNFDLYILPFVNPDGYEISTDTRQGRLRYWRKNARPPADNGSREPYRCHGVDLNRNYPFAWNYSEGEATSSEPCSEAYHGPSAASEPEIAALTRFVFHRKKRFLIFLTFHSYGQYWFVPWGYTKDIKLNDHDELVEVAQVAADSMKIGNYTKWNVGQSSQLMYIASGTAEDWAKAVANIKYSYCIELPPDDDAVRGFILPDTEIIRVAQSVYNGIEALVREVDKRSRKV